MAITYTVNFTLPLLTDGSSNWGSVVNGLMEIIDLEMKAAQTPIVTMTPDVVISRLTGEVILKHYQI